ncbi:serine/threonine-protein kinase [Calothrix sp. 336/3]|uniref:serine/threonine-protein kinase n=1 Tax=Calothrix sp. 336/3 TaxID=1337936 RepID=UPI0006997EA4|nr:serine/threonine-protein kinase [Calothrix sp. 336/3]
MFWNEGQTIHNGKYRIERYLGGGGFALTYLATHTQLNRPVVIKTPNINVQNDPEYPKYVERFQKEGQMLAQVCKDSHPHIVQAIDLFEDDNRHCLVMQYIPGMSLWDLVRQQGKLPETTAVKYIQQIGLALVEVHRRNYLHLDVTPMNIMINSESGTGKAVLIDFGIAADMSPPSTLSRSFGNRAFAPYELLRRGVRHPTVDIYCLAASLYYAVTGEMPTNSLARKWEDEELISPQQYVSSLSQSCCDAILQGMALEASKRSQTMEDWLCILSPIVKPIDMHTKSDLETAYKVLTKEDVLSQNLSWEIIQVSTQKPTQKTAKRNSNFLVDVNFSISTFLFFYITKSIIWLRNPPTRSSKILIVEGTIQKSENKSSEVELKSDVGVDYSNLEKLLKAQNWKEADQETARLMLKVANREEEGYLDIEQINNFPCADLRTIDQLWLKCSDGRFGFSVQKRIYQSLGGTEEYDEKIWEAFGDRVGWRKKGSWMYYKDSTFSLEAPEAHLPMVRARWWGVGSLLSRPDL